MFLPELGVFLPELGVFLPELGVFLPELWAGHSYTHKLLIHALVFFVGFYNSICPNFSLLFKLSLAS